MANHVSFSVQFDEDNSTLMKEKWRQITQKLHNDESSDGEYWFGDLFTNENLSLDDVRQYSWTTSEIGPKWCYIQEYDDDGFYGYSAWDAPERGLEKLLSEIAGAKDITSITYEDEGLNFAGYSIYEGEEVVDGCQDEYEEIIERCQQVHDDLKDRYNFDEEAWLDEESEEFFNDNVWETLSDEYSCYIIDVVDSIKAAPRQEENGHHDKIQTNHQWASL